MLTLLMEFCSAYLTVFVLPGWRGVFCSWRSRFKDRGCNMPLHIHIYRLEPLFCCCSLLNNDSQCRSYSQPDPKGVQTPFPAPHAAAVHNIQQFISDTNAAFKLYLGSNRVAVTFASKNLLDFQGRGFILQGSQQGSSKEEGRFSNIQAASKDASTCNFSGHFGPGRPCCSFLRRQRRCHAHRSKLSVQNKVWWGLARRGERQTPEKAAANTLQSDPGANSLARALQSAVASNHFCTLTLFIRAISRQH